MSQDRVNELGRQLDGQLAAASARSPVVDPPVVIPVETSKVAELQEEMDREARASLVISWLGLEGPPADWG
jgi:hypothetical protein